MTRHKVFAISAACLAVAAAATAAVAWQFTTGPDVHASTGKGAATTIAASNPTLEIRWHGGGIVLQGQVRDEATQRALAEGAAARLGGESEQVIDWLDITPTGLPVADAAALARLIQLGQEGWHLQRGATEGWLAVPSPTDTRNTEAAALLQTAFGPGVAMRLIALP